MREEERERKKGERKKNARQTKKRRGKTEQRHGRDTKIESDLRPREVKEREKVAFPNERKSVQEGVGERIENEKSQKTHT